MKCQILFRSVQLVVLTLSLHSAFAQPLSQAEGFLYRQLQIIDSFADVYSGPDHIIGAYDSISRYDSLFGETLQKLTAGSHASLHYPFTRLQSQGLTIATSSDRRLRIYSWDGQTGGTAHNANNVFQYEINGKVYSTLIMMDGGPGDSYSAIYPLKTGDKTFYLAVSEAVIATLQLHATLEVLQLEGDSLRSNVPLIRTGSGMTGTLGFDYTLDNDSDAGFHFNPTSGTITFPVVLDDGHVTKRKITYAFNGKYFARTNN
jgi:hypothetical protein